MNKFTWTKFDNEFINSIVYSKKTKIELVPTFITEDNDTLIPFMEDICQFPDEKFVIRYRTEIEFRLLKKWPELVAKIYKSIEPKSGNNNNSWMLNDLTSMKLTATLIGAYISALAEIGGSSFVYEDASRFSIPITIDMTKSIASDVPLYEFQKEAVEKLTDNFIKQNKAAGLLVMPTGSGKTRTAVCFLLKNLVSKGYQVIWLTHRHMLIDQTADAFYNFAPLVKLENKNIKKIKMACISGEHATIKATEKDDNIMILSVQSVCRNLDYLKKVLAENVIVVVDEAHHTVAKSYRKTIDYIRKVRKNAKLLGLTATPVRMNDKESKYLLQLFDNNIIYSIPMSELITKQILAEPEFERIETGTDVEAITSIDEEKFIKKWGELSPSLVEKIAHSCERNDIIVNTYVENKEKYGKTLIFALNAYHCISLCEELQKKGIRCDYIYSLHDGNEAKIRRFKAGELDVLVNINILTEGSDVPDIQTVFITRPTQSDVLIMQMIGRGMRGKSAGGTEKVNIVDFCDKWDVFTKWLNPQWLIDTRKIDPDSKKGYGSRRPNFIPLELFHDIINGISYIWGSKAKKTIALPAGWYSLLDSDGNDYHMLVFADQIHGFKKLLEDRKHIIEDKSITTEDLQKYFGGFEMPPRNEDLELFLDNLREDNEMPHMFSFEDRKIIDPAIVSLKIKDERLDLFAYPDELYEENEIIENIFGSIEAYRQRIFDFINYKDGIPPIGIKVEEMPIELIPFRQEPIYDIKVLTKEVINEMFEGEFTGIKSIDWTDKVYKQYYGVYRLDDSIRINCLLNSPDVPRETVKYVIYHELLHHKYWNHDKTFRKEEHKYPDYTEHERFLDFGISKFEM
ncbi:DEAD/DEAH box helicase family protein [Clostridium sp.]|uniref:DEAD/DEAH box helicase family protein n=1 Tax=Clostridium sp. TaxID=1506 RepID=UPI003D6CB946